MEVMVVCVEWGRGRRFRVGFGKDVDSYLRIRGFEDGTRRERVGLSWSTFAVELS